MNILVSTAAPALAILPHKAALAPDYIAIETRLYMEVLTCQVFVFADTPAAQVVDWSVRSRCFVHILNSVRFFEAAGVPPPERPPTAAAYAVAGRPWFDYYGAT